MKTKDIAIIGLYGVLITLSSQIRIPIGIVPITLQVLTLTFGSLKLSMKQIQLSILTFIILTFLGVLNISGTTSGPQLFLTPSFSFIIAFFFMAYVINKNKNIKGLLLGHFTLYGVALPILYVYLKFMYHMELTIIDLFTLYYLPFIIGDSISMFIAYTIAKRMPDLS